MRREKEGERKMEGGKRGGRREIRGQGKGIKVEYNLKFLLLLIEKKF